MGRTARRGRERGGRKGGGGRVEKIEMERERGVGIVE